MKIRKSRLISPLSLFSYVLVCIPIVFCLLAVFQSNNTYAAYEYYENVEVELDGERLYFQQQSALNVNGNIMVPMRELFEKLGAKIEWNSSTKTIKAQKNDTKISITINKDTATVNGKKVTLSEPAKVINGATMVPLRFVSESLGSKVYWYNEISTVVIVPERKASSVVTLNSSDYSISYLSKQQMKELKGSDPYIYYYTLSFKDYIDKNYPNAAFIRDIRLTGLERGRGFNSEDKYSGYKIDIPNNYTFFKSDSDNKTVVNNDIDHYINLFDKNDNYIVTLHIPIEVPKESIQDGYSIKEKYDLKKLATATGKLNNATFNPIIKWDYAAVDHSKYKYNSDLKTTYKYDTLFQSDLNHYIGFYTLKNNKLNEYSVKLDFLKGLEVDVELIYKNNDQNVQREWKDNFNGDNELKLTIDPKKVDGVDISIKVKNPVNYTRSFYTFELKELPHINSLISFGYDYLYVSNFLPNDKFIIEIPGTITSSGKSITINEKIKSNSYYSFKDYVKNTHFKESLVRDTIKIKVLRGNKTVYNYDYIYSTHKIPTLKAKNYKYNITQYTESELLEKNLVSGYPNMFGGIIDLSNNKNVVYASQSNGVPERMGFQDFMHTGNLDKANNVEYDFGMLVTVKKNEKYKLSRKQTLYFILYDKDRYPIGLLPIEIQLKAGYIHSKGQIVN